MRQHRLKPTTRMSYFLTGIDHRLTFFWLSSGTFILVMNKRCRDHSENLLASRVRIYSGNKDERLQRSIVSDTSSCSGVTRGQVSETIANSCGGYEIRMVKQPFAQVVLGSHPIQFRRPGIDALSGNGPIPGSDSRLHRMENLCFHTNRISIV